MGECADIRSIPHIMYEIRRCFLETVDGRKRDFLGRSNVCSVDNENVCSLSRIAGIELGRVCRVLAYNCCGCAYGRILMEGEEFLISDDVEFRRGKFAQL